MYIPRLIEHAILQMVESFKVILITGSRQVGKSTTLSHLFGESDYEYVTLDHQFDREIAQNDPKAFFLNHPGTLIIDEIQYAPNLFQEIKYRVDQSEDYGQYILTGSQTFSLMQGVSESLAGRIGILQMSGLSLREILRDPFKMPFIPTDEYLTAVRQEIHGPDLWSLIHRGSLPELTKNPSLDREQYYSSYVTTYLERDVRSITKVSDLGLFSQFMGSIAARVAQLVNYTDIAREIGVDNKTIKSWIAILQTSGLIYLVQPFSNNRLSRVVKTPTLYFLDTGLAAYLLKWLTPETMMHGAMSGPLIENFAVSEIIKTFYSSGINHPPITFYRDQNQREIDLIIEASGQLYPVEIKKSVSPNLAMAKHLKLLDKADGFKVARNMILSQVTKKTYLSEDLIAYPIGAI